MSVLNSVRFSATALAGTGKQGILPPDADGYYETVLGGLNVFNSVGEFYTAEGVKELFADSGLLQKRIQKGRLRSELGHPKKLPGESDQAFINRIFLINEDRVCAHIREVYLDADRVKGENGQSVIAIIGKVKPAGPFADVMQKSFENKHENTAFSIRAFTDDQRIRGIMHRYLKTIVTWDFVSDPGISIAGKWNSPALETLDTHLFTRGQIENTMNQTSMVGIAQESAMAASMNAHELFQAMGWSLGGDPNTAKPAFLKW